MKTLELNQMEDFQGGSFPQGVDVNLECGMYALGWVGFSGWLWSCFID